jgi:hypothetical protein
VDLNLDTLKREILEYLNASGLAVFHGRPGGMEGQSLVLWDTERHPDYRMFLDVARKSDCRVIVFAVREFQSADIDDLLDHLDEIELSREEQREYERRLREMRIYEGITCSLEMAFDYNSRLYVYEMQPDWYDEFLTVEDDIVSRLTDPDDMDDDEPLGGYYSKN